MCNFVFLVICSLNLALSRQSSPAAWVRVKHMCICCRKFFLVLIAADVVLLLGYVPDVSLEWLLFEQITWQTILALL